MDCELSTQFRLCSPIQHSSVCGPDQSFPIPWPFSRLSAPKSFVSHTCSPFSRKSNLSHTYRKTGGGTPTSCPTMCYLSDRSSILPPPTRISFPSESRDPRALSRYFIYPMVTYLRNVGAPTKNSPLGKRGGLRQCGMSARQF